VEQIVKKAVEVAKCPVTVKIRKGDAILVCSDGFWELIEDNDNMSAICIRL